LTLGGTYIGAVTVNAPNYPDDPNGNIDDIACFYGTVGGQGCFADAAYDGLGDGYAELLWSAGTWTLYDANGVVVGTMTGGTATNPTGSYTPAQSGWGPTITVAWQTPGYESATVTANNVWSQIPVPLPVLTDARITLSGSGNSSSCYQDYLMAYRLDIADTLGGSTSPLMYVSLDGDFVAAYTGGHWCVVKLAGAVQLFKNNNTPQTVVGAYTEVSGGGTAAAAFSGKAADVPGALEAQIRMRS
jgi:hypothetical protein